MRLGICFPITGDYVPRQFWMSMMTLAIPDNSRMYVPQHPSGHLESMAAVRNNLVLQAMSEDCTHVVMMDTDQVYPKYTLERLLHHDKPAVAAKVHRRYPPYDPILYRGTVEQWEQVPDEEWTKGGLVEVNATGFGCALFTMDLIYDLEQPYFDGSTKTSKGLPIGEDIYFWGKVKAAGHRVFVDCSIDIHHLALHSINKDYYMLTKALGRT